MFEHIITVGLFDKDAHVQTKSKQYFLDVIEREICARNFCATIFSDGITGIYRHEDGTIVREPSIRIEIAGPKRAEILPMLRTFCEVFNQETVLYKMQKQKYSFVSVTYEEHSLLSFIKGLASKLIRF